MSSKRRRLPRTAATLLGLVGYALVHYQTSGVKAPYCTVSAMATTDGAKSEVEYTLQPRQAANAATIEAVASGRNLPERAVTIALATAMQESSLRNIDYGDRDSLGLFQQRPSTGWGSAEEIMDPVYASGQFYDHLVKVPGYAEMPLTEAAQAVQRSAYPDEYAKHEPRAAMLTAALTGQADAALSCVTDRKPISGDPAKVRERMAYEFGDSVPLAREGHSITVPLPDTDRARGWELAHWGVAHAGDLGIERIDYDSRVWEADRSSEGWRGTGTDGDPATDDAEGTGGVAGELRFTIFE